MRRWDVIYDDGAREDILEIVDFIARDSAINADKVLDRIEHRIATLATLPERGRIVPELQWHGITTVREIGERPWRILYKLRATDVLVVAVYDGRRQITDLLLARFLRH